ncbi:MAG TPA: M56 family metallopeptidase [Holophagaceae bacterium]|nr:M56 family metallopeptidase [Holophagaceae bacterium]
MSPHLHGLVLRLGLTLLHFLWQGTLLALLLGAVRWVLQDRSPRLRHGLACGALLLMALAPCATWLLLGAPSLRSDLSEGAFALTKVGREAADVRVVDIRPWRAALPAAVALWSLGVGLLSLRLLGSWTWAQGLRRRRTTTPAPEALQRRLRQLAQRMGLDRAVQLLVCPHVPGPTVLGWLRPVILIPPAALTGLAPDQLEWILAHELAHVLRHDYAVNLLQSCVEVLLFYHPAVWWVSAKIRQERELCCDDLAVAISGDALDYAAALTHLEALRLRDSQPLRAAGPLALAATGGSFMHRIQRLIAPTSPQPLAPRAGLILLLLLGTGFGLQARHRLIPTQAPAPAPKPTTRLTFDLRKVELVQFLRILADELKVNLVVAPDVQGTVDLQFRDTPWDQILDAKLRPAGFAWRLENGILHVARASALQGRIRLTEALLKARTDGSPYTGRKITLDLQRVTIPDLLGRLAREGGITLTVDPAVQGTYNFRFTDTPWDQVLDVVLLTAGLDWEARAGGLHVLPKPAPPKP